MKCLAQFCSGLKVRVSNNSLTFHIYNFANNCVSNITANKERCQQLVDSSVGTVTALCPHIGYFRAAKIAKKAIAEQIPVRELILEENFLGKEKLDQILDVYNMTEPGKSPFWLSALNTHCASFLRPFVCHNNQKRRECFPPFDEILSTYFFKMEEPL